MIKSCFRIFLLSSIVIFPLNISAQMFGQEPSERVRTYDVENIKIEVKLDLEKKTVQGKVTASIRSLVDGLDAIKVDANGLNVISVKGWYHNATDKPELAEQFENIKYSYDRDTITINPLGKIAKNFSYKYQIEYSVTDPEKGLYFMQPSENQPQKRYEAWTQGEGEDNRYWIPCYDYPNDKATTEMIITADKKYETLSNGLLKEVKENSDGTKTWDWALDKPQSSYLIMLAVGNWDVIEDKYDDIPVYTYVPPGAKESSVKSFDRTADIVKFFSESIGYKYPWYRFSQVVVQDFVYGGMENTGAVVLTESALYDDKTPPDYTATSLVSHELAHMWWGDAVTCKNWNEIWLNESFATYYQCLYTEHAFGKDEFDYNIFRNGRGAINADSITARKPIYARDGLTVNTYDKGCVVLNMLRNYLGDEAYRKSLLTYITDNQFQNVTTTKLIEAINKTRYNPEMDHHSEISWFFNEWVYKAGQPEYQADYNYDESAKRLKINFKQVQKIDSLNSVFRTPVPIEIITSAGKQEVTAIPDTVSSLIFLELANKPKCVIFNKGNKVLCKLHFSKPKEDWMYQLENSEDAIDRICALKGLKDFINDNDVIELLSRVSNSDKFWGVKMEIAPLLAASQNSKAPEIFKDKIVNDPDPRVKRNYITNFPLLIDNNTHAASEKESIAGFIQQVINSESKSYYVISDGISVLKKLLAKDKIFDAISPFLKMESHGDVIRRYALDALENSDDIRAKDIFIEYALKGITTRTRNNAIGGLEKFLDDERVISLLNSSLLNNMRSTQNAILRLLDKALNHSSLDYIQELMYQSHDDAFRKRIRETLDKF